MFAYCGNNPGNSADPSGNRPIWEQYEGGNNGYTDSETCEYEIATGPYARAANCYAYAFHMEVDPRTNDYFTSKPQPGTFSGHEYSSILNGKPLPPEIAKKQIIKAVSRDGMALGALGFRIQEVSVLDCALSNTEWAVALVYDPAGDYHWYRQDNDGTWSHKPGVKPISSVDGDGNTIYDPATCNRAGASWNYTEFLGFFVVTRGG